MRSDDAFDVESQAAGVLPPIDVPAPLALRRTVIGFREGGARRMRWVTMNEGAVMKIQTRRQSRRGLLGLASAGAMALALRGRFSISAYAQTAFPGRFRVLHASPDLGKIEVLFNGEKKLDEFQYGQASDWIDVDPGLVRITVQRDRLLINDVVFDLAIPVIADEHYEFIISDPLVIPAPVDRAPLPVDTARARAIHASIDTPVIDIAMKGGDPVLIGLGYGQITAPLEVPAGLYDLELRVHETGEVLAEVPQVPLGAGTVSDLVIYGKPGDANAPLTVSVLTDPVRVLPAGATPAATPTG
jgi:hypothetical protein